MGIENYFDNLQRDPLALASLLRLGGAEFGDSIKMGAQQASQYRHQKAQEAKVYEEQRMQQVATQLMNKIDPTNPNASLMMLTNQGIPPQEAMKYVDWAVSKYKDQQAQQAAMQEQQMLQSVFGGGGGAMQMPPQGGAMQDQLGMQGQPPMQDPMGMEAPQGGMPQEPQQMAGMQPQPAGGMPAQMQQEPMGNPNAEMALMASKNPGYRQLAEYMQQERHRREDKGSKVSEEYKKSAVPGYDIQEGILPSPEVAQKVRVAIESKNNLIDKTGSMRDIIDKYGPEYFGQNADAIEQYHKDATVDLKNAKDLGAITGSDYEILLGMLPNAADFTQWAKFNARDRALASIDRFQQGLEETTNKKISSYGYKPKNQQKAEQSSPAQAPSVAGAKQAPDGNWYIEQGGKFIRVDQ